MSAHLVIAPDLHAKIIAKKCNFGGATRSVVELKCDKETRKLGSTHWISPLQLRFTHDSVKQEFKPFYDDECRYITNKEILSS